MGGHLYLLLVIKVLTLWGQAIVRGESSSFIFRGFILLREKQNTMLKMLTCIRCDTIRNSCGTAERKQFIVHCNYSHRYGQKMTGLF